MALGARPGLLLTGGSRRRAGVGPGGRAERSGGSQVSAFTTFIKSFFILISLEVTSARRRRGSWADNLTHIWSTGSDLMYFFLFLFYPSSFFASSPFSLNPFPCVLLSFNSFYFFPSFLLTFYLDVLASVFLLSQLSRRHKILFVSPLSTFTSLTTDWYSSTTVFVPRWNIGLFSRRRLNDVNRPATTIMMKSKQFGCFFLFERLINTR